VLEIQSEIKSILLVGLDIDSDIWVMVERKAVAGSAEAFPNPGGV